MNAIKRRLFSINWQNWLKVLALLGLGLYFTGLILTGNLANYINLRFQWLVYVAAALLLAFAVWNAYHLLTGRAMQQVQHVRVTWSSLLVMLIPLVLGVGVPSQPLGASAINGDISMNAVGFNTATAYQKPPLERNILDWLREFNGTSNAATLNGQPVDVIGFVYREPGMAENQFMVARFTMSCCVADAFAIGMPVEYDDAAQFTDGDWVRIQGTLQAGEFRKDTAPIIQPTSVEPADIPANAYLYS